MIHNHQAEDGIRDHCLSRGLGDVYKRQGIDNKDHWVEPHLPDLERDLKEEVGIEFD